jgi:hypothetical protein
VSGSGTRPWKLIRQEHCCSLLGDCTKEALRFGNRRPSRQDKGDGVAGGAAAVVVVVVRLALLGSSSAFASGIAFLLARSVLAPSLLSLSRGPFAGLCDPRRRGAMASRGTAVGARGAALAAGRSSLERRAAAGGRRARVSEARGGPASWPSPGTPHLLHRRRDSALGCRQLEAAAAIPARGA